MIAVLCVAVACSRLFLFCSSAWGLDDSRRVSQYAHTAWRLQDGLFSGTPNVITQTADGYLWIGTNTGLLRFDGVRLTPWVPAGGQDLKDARVFSLLGARDGSLWIGTGAGISRWFHNELTNYPSAHERILSIMEDPNGDIWIARSQIIGDQGPLCHFETAQPNAVPHCFGKSEGLVIPEVTAAAIDSTGEIWIGGVGGVFRCNSLGATSCFSALPGKAHQSLLRAITGGSRPEVWASVEHPSTPARLFMCQGETCQLTAPPGIPATNAEVSALYEDHQGALWVGTTKHGIFRWKNGFLDHLDQSDGLSSNAIAGFFEDREGDLWITTSKGFENLRDVSVISFSMREGLPTDTVSTVFASGRRLWVGGLNALSRFENGKISVIFSGHGLPGSNIRTIFEDHSGVLWLGLDGELLVVRGKSFRVLRTVDNKPLGNVFTIAEDSDHDVWVRSGTHVRRFHNQKIVRDLTSPEIATSYIMAADPNGGVVLGLVNGDMIRVSDTQTTTLSADPDARHQIRDMLLEEDGGIWATTLRELISMKDGRREKLDANTGLPCEGIYALVRDRAHDLWLDTKCGLVGVTDAELRRWRGDPKSDIRYRLLDALDGVQPGLTSLKPQAVRTSDGRLWFANGSILQMYDPSRSTADSDPPPVYVEGVVADRLPYSSPTGKVLQLPAKTRDVEIDYTGLSFISPQKVGFRYQLVGVDQDWKDAGSRRQAFYTDLPPGSYTFHVKARNGTGLWSQTGATYRFTIPPTFFQTRWFALICGLGVFVALCGLYMLRLRRLRREFRTRLFERLSERERIARELHDTLLQSLQGVILRFHTATMQISPKEPVRSLFETALDQADQVVAEGRRRVSDLRAGHASDDLAHILREEGQNLAANAPVDFSLLAEGEPRELRPVVQDEVRRIAHEALVNAFRHANAAEIRVIIRFSNDSLRIGVHDNGTGIEATVFQQGRRAGHWGFVGMQERAAEIGASLSIQSHPGTGTQIDLRVPAKLAYQRNSTRRLFHRSEVR